MRQREHDFPRLQRGTPGHRPRPQFGAVFELQKYADTMRGSDEKKKRRPLTSAIPFG